MGFLGTHHCLHFSQIWPFHSSSFLIELGELYELGKNIYEQGNPPAWQQEAYHLPHSKYSVCCSVSGAYPSPVLAGEYPSPVLASGVPQSCPACGGTLVLSGCIPVLGYPLPGTGVPPSPGLGYPCRKGPRTRDLGKNLGLGYPLGCEQTDTYENITFSILRIQTVIRANFCKYRKACGNG